MDIRLPVPKSFLTVMNQLYEMEQKLKKHGDSANLQRNVGKMKDALSEDGFPISDSAGSHMRLCLTFEDPMGQPFNETRTDLEATISGSGTDNLIVVEVIKPIIRAVSRDGSGEFSKVVQKGIVVVQSRKEN